MTRELITVNGWEKQAEWHGNPELGYESYKKTFKTKSGYKVPVFIFGKEGNGKNQPCRDINGKITHCQDFPDWQFVVSAGANSDMSYSGSFYPECPSLEQAMKLVDEMYASGKLLR